MPRLGRDGKSLWQFVCATRSLLWAQATQENKMGCGVDRSRQVVNRSFLFTQKFGRHDGRAGLRFFFSVLDSIIDGRAFVFLTCSVRTIVLDYFSLSHIHVVPSGDRIETVLDWGFFFVANRTLYPILFVNPCSNTCYVDREDRDGRRKHGVCAGTLGRCHPCHYYPTSTPDPDVG